MKITTVIAATSNGDFLAKMPITVKQWVYCFPIEDDLDAKGQTC